jgi:triosephosphate isomerase (TIM)
LRSALSGWRAPHASLIVAYEPVWAIGTGRQAGPDDVREMHRFIKHELCSLVTRGEDVRVVYGGSVSPEGCVALARLGEVEGFLVGTASLDPGKFKSIIANTIAGKGDVGAVE